MWPPHLIDSKMLAPLNRRQRGSGWCKAPTRLSPKRRIERYGKQRKEFARCCGVVRVSGSRRAATGRHRDQHDRLALGRSGSAAGGLATAAARELLHHDLADG
jgi:hypothetical protein